MGYDTDQHLYSVKEELIKSEKELKVPLGHLDRKFFNVKSTPKTVINLRTEVFYLPLLNLPTYKRAIHSWYGHCSQTMCYLKSYYLSFKKRIHKSEYAAWGNYSRPVENRVLKPIGKRRDTKLQKSSKVSNQQYKQTRHHGKDNSIVLALTSLLHTLHELI